MAETREIWIGSVDASRLIGISVRAVRKNIAENKYTVRMEEGLGGKQYRILLTSLPQMAQVRYFEQLVKDGKSEEDERPQDYLSTIEDYNRSRYVKYKSLINASQGLFGEELKKFLTDWNTRYPDMRADYTSLLRARKVFREQGEAGLVGKYGNRYGATKVPDDMAEIYKSLRLDQNRRTPEQCYAVVSGMALHKGVTIPSKDAFEYRFRREVPQSVYDYHVRGESYFNRYWANYVDRDYSQVAAGQIWVSDHRQLDFAVTLPNGKVVFPWITVWRDFKTSKWLGWSFHSDSPNSTHIMQAFYNAAIIYGVPRGIMIDNGKDYRSKDFAGGKVRRKKIEINEDEVRSLTAMYNIEVRFAAPYNAQAKPIERDFRIVKEWLDRSFITYRGGHTQERPERLAHAIKSGLAIKLDDADKLFEYFVKEILNLTVSGGKVLQGRSREEAWCEELAVNNVLRKTTPFELKLCCMKSSGDIYVGRNGITVSQKDNIYYYATWMEGMKDKKKCYIRRDPKHWEVAWVFEAKSDLFLGEARLNAFRAHAWAQDGLQKEELEEVLKQKRAAEKLAKLSGETSVKLTAEEQLELAALARQEKNRKKLPTPKESRMYVMTKMAEAARQQQLRTGTDDYEVGPLNKRKDDDELHGWE